MDWVAYLQQTGPFSTTVAVVLFGGMVWLARDRAEILSQLKAATDDRIRYRDKRADELQAATREYVQYGEAMGERMRVVESKLDRLLERVPAR